MLFIDWHNTPLVDFDHLQVSKKPHYCVVQPHCEGDRCIASPSYNMPIDQLKNRWHAMLKKQPRVKLLKSDPTKQHYQYVQRSKWMRFPDLIDVKFVALSSTKSTLYAYSRSVYGYSDLGVNCNRMHTWLKGLAQ